MTIYIAGHRGMVGSAIYHKLQASGKNIVVASRAELDLIDQNAVHEFLSHRKPKTIIIAAAKVGGIYSNSTYPADFLYENIAIQTNLIHGAYLNDVEKVICLGSSCIYPRNCKQPISESDLLTAPLEKTNEAYAIAKITAIKMCEAYNRQYKTDFRALMPCNLYGPNDNFHPSNSHVLPALIARFHNAKINNNDSVEIWGTGTPMREFLHVNDLADAISFVCDLPTEAYRKAVGEHLSHINVGYGIDVSIADLAHLIADIVGYTGNISFDKSRPDGTPKKLIDSSVLTSLGWRPKIDLIDGIRDTYSWYKRNLSHLRSI